MTSMGLKNPDQNDRASNSFSCMLYFFFPDPLQEFGSSVDYFFAWLWLKLAIDLNPQN